MWPVPYPGRTGQAEEMGEKGSWETIHKEGKKKYRWNRLKREMKIVVYYDASMHLCKKCIQRDSMIYHIMVDSHSCLKEHVY